MRKSAAADAVKRFGQRNANERFSFLGGFLFLLVLILGFLATQQYFAWHVAYHPALGGYMFALGPHKIYYPMQWMRWSYEYNQSTGMLGDYILRMHIGIFISTFLAVITGFTYYYFRSLKAEKVEDLHGSAYFAEDKDVYAMGLIPKSNKGIVVGAYQFENGETRLLRYNDAAHAACIAPTRTGKGVTIVLPTLLTYPESMFVHDIKGENYELSAGFRHKAGSLCLRLDPTHTPALSIDGKTSSLNSARFNILQEIRLFTEYDVMDAQNIAAAIADPDSKGMDDHWVSTSYELLLGIFLHVMYSENNKSLAGCAAFLADPSFSSPEQMFEHMIRTEHDANCTMRWQDLQGRVVANHPVVVSAAQAMLNKEEKERNSVLSTAKTRLALYMEPIVGKNTARSDFKINDLMNHEKPVSFYAVIPPSDKERLRPFTRLFITFLIRRMTKEMRFEDGAGARSYMHPLVGLIDELASLRKLDALQDGLGYVAGYGIRFYLVFQDYPQITDEVNGYGRNQQILSGCSVTVVFTPNSPETAELISKMTGTRTVEHQRTNFSGKRMGATLDQMSVSVELVQRPLMSPDEVRRMPGDESLIFVSGQPPIKGKKVPYYLIPEFARRAALAAPMRIGCSWRASEEIGAQYLENWMMASVEREDNQLFVYINVYANYPRIAPLIKQLVLSTGQIIELPVSLISDDGKVWDQELPLQSEVLRFRLDYRSPVGFDSREMFELHLPIAEKPALPKFEETGFFTALSEYEKEARKGAREKARKEEIDARFLQLMPTQVCLGEIYFVTNKCVVMHRGADTFYVIRSELLDKKVSEGDRVQVRFRNHKGEVQFK